MGKETEPVDYNNWKERNQLGLVIALLRDNYYNLQEGKRYINLTWISYFQAIHHSHQF